MAAVKGDCTKREEKEVNWGKGKVFCSKFISQISSTANKSILLSTFYDHPFKHFMLTEEQRRQKTNHDLLSTFYDHPF